MQETNTYKDHLFFPVSLKTMRIDSALSFDVFFRLKKDKMVLFLANDNTFSEESRPKADRK